MPENNPRPADLRGRQPLFVDVGEDAGLLDSDDAGGLGYTDDLIERYFHFLTSLLFGPGGGIRTHRPLTPKASALPTALLPDGITYPRG